MARKVYMGGARIDEDGNAYGGVAGDQTGREVAEGPYKLNKKGWLVFRAYDAGDRLMIAKAMKAACDNPHIGYDQYQRDSLYNAAEKVGFDPALVTEDVETDCSALVRVCCRYAGIKIDNFRTWSEPMALRMTGEFYQVALTDERCLQVGDILVTPTAGHTEIITRIDGDEDSAPAREVVRIMPVIKKGDIGRAVSVLQILLNAFSGAGLQLDGDFGPRTEDAVKQYQRTHNLDVDGVVGDYTWDSLLKG